MSDSFSQHRTRKTDKRYQFDGHQIVSDQIDKQGVETVCQYLEKTLKRGTAGHVVEFGCYVGTTTLFIRRLLDSYDQSESRQLHVYDSFEGLPPKKPQDANAAGVDFKAGELFVTKKELIREFAAANLTLPIIHKGWFKDLTAKDIPQPIAFAFLDGDFYESILDPLRLIWPQMTAGGYILIDDYMHEALPGVEQAVRDFFQGKSLRLQRKGNIAIIEL